MNSDSILYLIVAITAVSYVFDQFLDYINLNAQRREIPDEIAAFYDRTRYLKSLDYHKELTRFSFLTSAVGFIGSLLMLLLGGFGWLDGMLRTVIHNDMLLALSFFGVLVLASDILTLPFQLYSTFVIEEKYGFNKNSF